MGDLLVLAAISGCPAPPSTWEMPTRTLGSSQLPAKGHGACGEQCGARGRDPKAAILLGASAGESRVSRRHPCNLLVFAESTVPQLPGPPQRHVSGACRGPVREQVEHVGRAPGPGHEGGLPGGGALSWGEAPDWSEEGRGRGHPGGVSSMSVGVLRGEAREEKAAEDPGP